MQADFPRDSNDFYYLNISNLTLHSGTDTIFVYPQRQYNCNRKYYYSGIYNKISGNFYYGIFDEYCKIVVDMGTSPFRGAYYNEFTIVDSVTKRSRYIVMDSIVIEFNDDNYYDYPNKWISPKESDSICSKIANFVFDSPNMYFKITDDNKYIGVTKRYEDSLTYIIFNKQVTDSICKNLFVKNNIQKFNGLDERSNFESVNDTLYCISVNRKHFDYDSGYIAYLDIYSIYNGKKSLISDSSSIKKYFHKLKFPIPSFWGNATSWSPKESFRMMAKIDNTIILYYPPDERYFFYDYINKKFFDPVIKIINE